MERTELISGVLRRTDRAMFLLSCLNTLLRQQYKLPIVLIQFSVLSLSHTHTRTTAARPYNLVMRLRDFGQAHSRSHSTTTPSCLVKNSARAPPGSNSSPTHEAADRIMSAFKIRSTSTPVFDFLKKALTISITWSNAAETSSE